MWDFVEQKCENILVPCGDSCLSLGNLEHPFLRCLSSEQIPQRQVLLAVLHPLMHIQYILPTTKKLLDRTWCE
ncbi:rCG55288 [Rattus norvegicus]|uniref:RCG55288 n=1 Tax=Rattus norvegicus TaxID=10116 RepID=A6J856_RAT|nr:rCG55288 [Rattus norvegicus]